MSLPKLLTVKKAATTYGTDEASIRDGIERGDIEAYKIGRSTLVASGSVGRATMFPKRGKQTRIYFIQEGDDGPIKIGESNAPARRLVDHQCGNSRPLRLLGSFAANAWEEREVHKRFAGSQLRGEWHEPTPELVAFIESTCA